MKKREGEIKHEEQIEKLFENMASPFEIENIQEVFNGIRFEIVDAHVSKNGDFVGRVLCLGFLFHFSARVNADYPVIDELKSIELLCDNDFDPEKAEQEFAELDMFSWEAQ